MSRITITLDDETLAELRGQAGPGELSAYVLEAIRSRLRVEPIDRLLIRLDDAYGPLTDDELEEGEEWWHSVKERWSSMPERSSSSPEETGA